MPSRSIAAATCAGVSLLALFVITSWTFPGEGGRFVAALWSALREGGPAAAWWIGATGFGLWLVRTALRPTAQSISDAARSGVATRAPISVDECALGACCGAALMLAVGNALGSLGLFALAGGAANWILVGCGVFLLMRTLRDTPLARAPQATTDWHALVAPAAACALVALFVAAAASAPQWLWSSEFGGFDALSYHLELPKEWLMGQRPIGPVEGNVYSALPSFVEGAFVQVMALRGSVVEGAIACQFWAAFASLAAAIVVMRLVRTAVGEESGMVGFLLFLSLPWVLVVGTLAYNDIAPCLMLAGAWLLVERLARESRALDARSAALLALLAAAAVGAKPTAFFFVALPLLAIVLLRCGMRALRFAPLVVAIAVVALLPWLVRNQLAYGNALFPFAHTLLGNGPWSEEQFAAFARGHGAGMPFVERLPLLWSQWIAHGLGDAPASNEPWSPQWGLLPIAGLVGLAVEARRSAAARAALAALAIALLGWLLATHLKSRFLLPTAVPLTVGAAMLVSRIARATQPRAAAILLAPAVLLPFYSFWREPAKPLPTAPGAPAERLRAPATFIGDTAFMTGERLARDIESADAETRAKLAPQATTAYFVNFALPAEARILAIGYSTPFYLRRPIAWTTVWDRGALDAVAAQNPGTPGVWGAKLHELGYTHLIVQPTMLVVWTQSGWINPDLEPKRWLTAFLQANPTIRTSDGCFIVELRGAQAAAPASPAAPAPAAAPGPSGL